MFNYPFVIENTYIGFIQFLLLFSNRIFQFHNFEHFKRTRLCHFSVQLKNHTHTAAVVVVEEGTREYFYIILAKVAQAKRLRYRPKYNPPTAAWLSSLTTQMPLLTIWRTLFFIRGIKIII